MQFVALRRIHDPHPLNLRLPSSAQPRSLLSWKAITLVPELAHWSLQSPAAANALGGLLDKSGLTTELSTPPPISPHCPPLLSTSEDSWALIPCLES